jgi:hypothetical protein
MSAPLLRNLVAILLFATAPSPLHGKLATLETTVPQPAQAFVEGPSKSPSQLPTLGLPPSAAERRPTTLGRPNIAVRDPEQPGLATPEQDNLKRPDDASHQRNP